MNYLLNKMCFRIPKSSYDSSLPHLHIDTNFVTRKYNVPWKARTLLIFHDLEEDIGCWDVNLYANQLGCHIVVIEYPGYGLQPGNATEIECHALVLHIYEIYKNQDCVLLGNGWGCYFSCFLSHYLSKRQIFLPMILLNPHLSFLQSFPYLSFLKCAADVLDIKTLAPDILSDVLILHGKNNKVIPYQQAEQLAAILRYVHKYYLIDRADHDLSHTTIALYHIRSFLLFHPMSVR